MYSLQKSSSSLPVSLILFDSISREFVGHARLCRVLERTDACFIESVIIVPESRGKGLGRELMHLIEDYAHRRGFHLAYLTSENKQAFYAKLGYSYCEPVTASSSCHMRAGGVVKQEVRPVPPLITPRSEDTMTPPAPPPPPPPPLPVSHNMKRPDRDWMMKVLSP